jgi:hypothetical protein
MGHFLAATAFHSESTHEVVQAISTFLRTYEVKHELLSGAASLNDDTDAQVFEPARGWVVVLWPKYFNIHDFPLAKEIAEARSWLVSTVHVYDGDYWEHLAVLGARELHSHCSRPSYWQDEPAELERMAHFNSAPEALAQVVKVPVTSLQPYLVDAEATDEDAMAHAEDQFPLSDIWVFTDFWRRLGIVYPEPPESPAAVVRLSKWFGKRLPQT